MIRDRPTVYSNDSLTKCEDPRILEYFLQSQHPCATDPANPRDCLLFQASFSTNFVFLLTIPFLLSFLDPPGASENSRDPSHFLFRPEVYHPHLQRLEINDRQ